MARTLRRDKVLLIWMAAGSLLLSGLLASGESRAHLPIYETGGDSYESALVIADITVSYAVYAEFDWRESWVHYYAVEASDGDELYFELNIPAMEPLSGFAPEIIVAGSGLPDPNEENLTILDVLDINLPEGAGMLRWTFDDAVNTTLPAGTENEEEFEPFGQVLLWKRQSARFDLPSAGLYYILVIGFYPLEFDINELLIRFKDQPGKYLLVTGYAEQFGFLDFVKIPLDWIRIRVFWGGNPLLFLLPTYLTVVLGLLGTGYYLRWVGWEQLSGMPTARRGALFAGLGASLLMIGGGINQLYFLLSSPLFDVRSIAALVLAFQALAVILGLLAFKLTMILAESGRPRGLVASVVVVVIALVVGSGFVIGPMAFLSSSLTLVLLKRHNTKGPD